MHADILIWCAPTQAGQLKLAFKRGVATLDGGSTVRELDERLGLEAIIAEHLRDSRHGLNMQFRLPDLLR